MKEIAQDASFVLAAIRKLRIGLRRLAGLDQATMPHSMPLSSLTSDPAAGRIARYGGALAACALTTGIALVLRSWLDPVNLVMLYLLAVVLVTVRFGRGAGILASFLAVLAFDVFLVPPYYSLSVANTEYVLTFAIMLAVSVIISHLTASLKQQVFIAFIRERRAQALFDLAKELSGALTCVQIGEIGVRHVQAMFMATACVLIADRKGRLRTASAAVAGDTIQTAAQRIFDCQNSGQASDTGVAIANVLYLPLRAPMRTRGMLALSFHRHGASLTLEQERLLQTVAAQIALAVERVHYVEVAQATTVAMESERLRNSLLSAVSHDIRTPLTAIVGMAGTLAENENLHADAREELARTIQDSALRLNHLVSNLLEMARLHAGDLILNRQWQLLEEVVGSALALTSPALETFKVQVCMPPDLPLLEFDAVLIERVLGNLLDNAAKHAAAGQNIRVLAEHRAAVVQVAVEDEGPGIPPGMEGAIFDKFARARREPTVSGVGLGLSICRTIIEAHHGQIWAENKPGGGARFVFTLPAGSPPSANGIAA